MSKTPPKLSVETVVVCDEVRHEDSGKTMLIGAYNHNIMFEEFPVSRFTFQIWIQLKTEGKGKVPVSIRFKRDKKQIARGKMEIQINTKKNSLTACTIPSPVLDFKKPCQLEISLQFPGKPWKTIKVLDIEKQKPSH